MGMTAAEKILARASGVKATRAGEILHPMVDFAMIHDGVVMGVETTSAIEGGAQFRTDPAAMMGFYSAPEGEYFLNHADEKVRVAEDGEQVDKALAGRGNLPHRPERDLNAAKNILAAGRAVARDTVSGDACGADVRRQGPSLPRSAVKQETRAARPSA